MPITFQDRVDFEGDPIVAKAFESLGTGGTGFLGLKIQSTAPNTPAAGLRLYASGSGTLCGIMAGSHGQSYGDVLSHDYYAFAFATEDAVGALISRDEGGHGSGLDLIEVDADGALEDKWTIVRGSSTTGSSNLLFYYGTNKDFASNTGLFGFSKTGELSIASHLRLNGASNQFIYTPTNFTIVADTTDTDDTKRLQLAGGGSTADSRGAYINLMGNEYTGQQGDLSLLAGNSGVADHGRIRMFVGGSETAFIAKEGNKVLSIAALATTATDGFVYLPTCAGTPTGTPTAYTGVLPLVIDSTNHKLLFYSGGSWRDVGP
jgi:hypothetical protein